jgi:energy-coupling factor transporter ATP-binding protein EcfA2
MILNAIAEWKIDSDQEKKDDYFCDLPELRFEKVYQGKRNLVVGRKGCGKTALAKHMQNLDVEDTNRHTSLHKFPLEHFHKILCHEESEYGFNCECISLWKYIIYMLTLDLMSEHNEDIPKRTWNKTREKITSLFNIRESCKVYGIDVSTKEIIKPSNAVPDLEKKIIDILSRSTKKYFILFDEFEESLERIGNQSETSKKYLVCLVKAVLDIIKEYDQVIPIIFLRRDIFNVLRNNDKAKWYDIIHEITWNHAHIQKIIQNRIKHEISQSDLKDKLSIADDWNYLRSFVLSHKPVKLNKKKRPDIFDHIQEVSQGRPRDYIAYMKFASEKAVDKKHDVIEGNDVLDAKNKYSKFMREEVISELNIYYKDGEKLFKSLQKLRNHRFDYNDLSKIYPEEQAEDIISKLYILSIIGIALNTDKTLYFYLDDENWYINPDTKFRIHPAFKECLRLI